MFPQHARLYMRLKGHCSRRAERSPLEKRPGGSCTGKGRAGKWPAGGPEGASVGKGLVGDGKTWRWEMERQRGNNGRGASHAELTIDWSHAGRCYAWPG